jgi:hypothetical protein
MIDDNGLLARCVVGSDDVERSSAAPTEHQAAGTRRVGGIILDDLASVQDVPDISGADATLRQRPQRVETEDETPAGHGLALVPQGGEVRAARPDSLDRQVHLAPAPDAGV